jgi:hypothetical protein
MSAAIRRFIPLNFDTLMSFASMIGDVSLFKDEVSLRVIYHAHNNFGFGLEGTQYEKLKQLPLKPSEVIQFGVEFLSIALEDVANEDYNKTIFQFKSSQELGISADDEDAIELRIDTILNYFKILCAFRLQMNSFILTNDNYNVQADVFYKGNEDGKIMYEALIIITFVNYEKLQEEAIKTVVAPVINAPKKDKKKPKKEQTKSSNNERDRKNKEREAYYKSIGIVYKKK